MRDKYILTDYINQAVAKDIYDKLDDGTFSGKIPGFKGVIAFGKTLKEWKKNCALHWKIGFLSA